MDIILLEDIDKVGDKHDIVTVKNGYGRNFLIPQKLALLANSTNRARLAEFRARESAQEQRRLGEYQDIATKLEGKILKIGAKAGESGRIFGSVTALQVMNALQEQFGVEVPRRKIVLPEDVKEIGSYKVTLNLHPEVQHELTFEVIKE